MILEPNGLSESSSCKAWIIAASVAVLLVNVYVSLRRREPAGDDPWQAHTLEWATTSPPPPHNFDRLPEIRSARPVYDARVAAGSVGKEPS